MIKSCKVAVSLSSRDVEVHNAALHLGQGLTGTSIIALLDLLQSLLDISLNGLVVGLDALEYFHVESGSVLKHGAPPLDSLEGGSLHAVALGKHLSHLGGNDCDLADSTNGHLKVIILQGLLDQTGRVLPQSNAGFQSGETRVARKAHFFHLEEAVLGGA